MFKNARTLMFLSQSTGVQTLVMAESPYRHIGASP